MLTSVATYPAASAVWTRRGTDRGVRRLKRRRCAAARLSASLRNEERGGLRQMSSGEKILILPGFLSGTRAYVEMAESLRNEGYDADILEIRNSEWYPTLLGYSFEWYVQRLAAEIDTLHSLHGNLTLIAHSAGGWIARICLGSRPYMGVECNRISKVRKLITLGTPHLSIEEYPFSRFNEDVFSVRLQETGNEKWSSSLQFANELYKDASELEPVQLITIVGSGFHGRNLTLGMRLSYLLTTGNVPHDASVANFAHASYLANCGRGDVDGDGVCPVETSLLPGADHLVLPDVYHGPNRHGLIWYGSRDGIQKWRSYLDP